MSSYNTPTQAQNDLRYATLQETVNTVSVSGIAATIADTSLAGINDITLTGNAVLTFPIPGSGKQFTLRLTQDATGGRTVTWPASVKWSGGIAPVLSSGGTKQDILSFISITGTEWNGFIAGLDLR